MLIVGGGIASPRPRPHSWVTAPHLSGFQSSSLSWQIILTVMRIGHCLRSSKTPHFQNDAKCRTFLVKMSFTCMAIKIISLSNAEHLTSFWYRFGGTRKWLKQSLSINHFPQRSALWCGDAGERGKRKRAGDDGKRKEWTRGSRLSTAPFPSCIARLLFDSPLSIIY